MGLFSSNKSSTSQSVSDNKKIASDDAVIADHSTVTGGDAISGSTITGGDAITGSTLIGRDSITGSTLIAGDNVNAGGNVTIERADARALEATARALATGQIAGYDMARELGINAQKTSLALGVNAQQTAQMLGINAFGLAGDFGYLAGDLGSHALGVAESMGERVMSAAEMFASIGYDQTKAVIDRSNQAREMELAQTGDAISRISDAFAQAKQGDSLTLSKTVTWGMAIGAAALIGVTFAFTRK